MFDGGMDSGSECQSTETLSLCKIFLPTVRAHWTIESALRWQLDVPFRKDAAQPKDKAPSNLAVLRCRALHIVRRGISKDSRSIKYKKTVGVTIVYIVFSMAWRLRDPNAIALGEDAVLFHERVWF